MILLGHRGTLGAAIHRTWEAKGPESEELVCPDSRELFETFREQNAPLPPTFHEQLAKGALSVVCAVGVIDPRAAPQELDYVNAVAPAALYQKLTQLAGEQSATQPIRFFTFGSALENKPEIAKANPYIDSKRALLALREKAAKSDLVAWHHIQLHTLYGGERSHSFMFLDQMKAALTARQAFRMSSGEQRREYHHVFDVASNLLTYIRSADRHSQLVDFSSGSSVRLRDLATQVFRHFGVPELLELGSLDSLAAEVYENCFQRSEHVVVYRDPIKGVIEWLESQE